jgi:hypothetical protein
VPAKTAKTANPDRLTAPARPPRWPLIVSGVLFAMWMLFLLDMALTA